MFTLAQPGFGEATHCDDDELDHLLKVFIPYTSKRKLFSLYLSFIVAFRGNFLDKSRCLADKSKKLSLKCSWSNSSSLWHENAEKVIESGSLA